jgi:hypothetical protein
MNEPLILFRIDLEKTKWPNAISDPYPSRGVPRILGHCLADFNWSFSHLSLACQDNAHELWMNGLRISKKGPSFPNEMRGYVEDSDYLLVIHRNIEIDSFYGWLGNPKVQKLPEPLEHGVDQRV